MPCARSASARAARSAADAGPALPEPAAATAAKAERSVRRSGGGSGAARASKLIRLPTRSTPAGVAHGGGAAAAVATQDIELKAGVAHTAPPPAPPPPLVAAPARLDRRWASEAAGTTVVAAAVGGMPMGAGVRNGCPRRPVAPCLRPGGARAEEPPGKSGARPVPAPKFWPAGALADSAFSSAGATKRVLFVAATVAGGAAQFQGRAVSGGRTPGAPATEDGPACAAGGGGGGNSGSRAGGGSSGGIDAVLEEDKSLLLPK